MKEVINFDCIYFKGDRPCIINKNQGKICSDCDEYIAVSKKILVIKLGAAGDVIRSTPLLVKYRELYGNCQIYWLTQYPEVLPKDVIYKILKFGFDSYIFLKSLRFDIAVNLDKEVEACALMKEIKAEEKYGYSLKDGDIYPLSEAAMNKFRTGIFDSESKINTKSYQEEIFEICGFKFDREPYLINFDTQYVNKWRQIREKAGAKKIIGLNTGCGERWQTRLWNDKYWEELIGRLQARNYFVVLLGGKDEDERNKKLSEITSSFYKGYFPLNEFINIVSCCDLIVSAVSMSMHIAIALGKKLILFNNIFNKNEFELYGNGEIIEPPSGCECYYGNTCKREKRCMDDIKPEYVFERIVANIPPDE